MNLEANNFHVVKYTVMLLAIAATVLAALYIQSPDEFVELWSDITVDTHAYDAAVIPAAERHGVDPALVRAVIFQESSFRPDMRGSKGEIGLMQLMKPAAVADYERVNRTSISEQELFEPETNIEVGCWFLGRALREYRDYAHGVELALAQYNAGRSRAREWAPQDREDAVIDRITIPSTRRYVAHIMRRYEKYQNE